MSKFLINSCHVILISAADQDPVCQGNPYDDLCLIATKQDTKISKSSIPIDEEDDHHYFDEHEEIIDSTTPETIPKLEQHEMRQAIVELLQTEEETSAGSLEKEEENEVVSAPINLIETEAKEEAELPSLMHNAHMHLLQNVIHIKDAIATQGSGFAHKVTLLPSDVKYVVVGCLAFLFLVFVFVMAVCVRSMVVKRKGEARRVMAAPPTSSD